MEFNIGEKVVYPNHGVGIIEQVTSRQVNGVPEEFYMLRIHSNDSLVMVPTSNVDSVGLRKIIRKSDVTGLFKLLEEDFFEPEADWKGRYKDHSEKMRTGSRREIGSVSPGSIPLAAAAICVATGLKISVISSKPPEGMCMEDMLNTQPFRRHLPI